MHWREGVGGGSQQLLPESWAGCLSLLGKSPGCLVSLLLPQQDLEPPSYSVPRSC